jgi:hypothetical protein
MADPLNPQTSLLTKTTLAPGVQWAQSNSPSLKKTRLGLSLITITIVICVIGILAFSFGSALFMVTKYYESNGIKVTISVLYILIDSLLFVVGPYFCLAVPAESGAKGFLAWSIVLSLISIISSIVYIIAPTAFPPIVFYVIGICPFIGFLLFLVFIKKLSEYIGRNDLAARSKTVLVVFLIYSAINLSALAMPLKFLVALVAGLVFLIMYFSLLDALRLSLGKVDKPKNCLT